MRKSWQSVPGEELSQKSRRRRPDKITDSICASASASVLEYEGLYTFAKHQNKPISLFEHHLTTFTFILIFHRDLCYNSATIHNNSKKTCFWPLVSLGEDEKRRKARKIILSHLVIFLSHLLIFLSHLLISNIISGCLQRDWWLDTDHSGRLCWATKAFNRERGWVWRLYTIWGLADNREGMMLRKAMMQPP